MKASNFAAIGVVGLILSGIALTKGALADILMIDLNLSLGEVKAVKEAAQTRKEKLWVYPELPQF